MSKKLRGINPRKYEPKVTKINPDEDLKLEREKAGVFYYKFLYYAILPASTLILFGVAIIVIFLILPLSALEPTEDGEVIINIITYSVAFTQVLYTVGITIMTIVISGLLKKFYELIIEKGSR